MSRYGQHCPITRSLEILGDRWTLLIVRELLFEATRFNELARRLPGMSRGLLSKRLGQMERNGLVEHSGDTYRPTPACEELRPLIFDLAAWGGRWAFGEPRPDELDVMVLMWWIRARIDPSPLGGRRIVLNMHVPDASRQRFWFIIRPDDVSLCPADPGFDVDVTLTSSLSVLYQVWNGVIEPEAAVHDGLMTMEGPQGVVTLLPQVLRFSPVAPYVRKARADTGAH